MSRLLIPNTCQVPNVLLDKVMSQLGIAAFKVLMAIVRLTYGFGVTSRQIGMTQLSRITGLTRQGVIKGIKALGNLITVKRSEKNSRVPNEYSLNIDISTGELVNELDWSTKVTSQHERLELVNESNTRLINQVYSLKPNKSKPNLKPTTAAVFLKTVERVIGRINELSGKGYKPEASGTSKQLMARLKAGATVDECLLVVEDVWKAWRGKQEMKRHYNPVTLFRQENFEKYLVEAQSNGNGRSGEYLNVRPEEGKYDARYR
jgi:uncharacterized phage protein (TIGR02220 family)